MAKLTVLEAEKVVPVGKSTLYKDMDDGTLAFSFDARGKKVIDTSELDRVYGLETPPSENGKDWNSETEQNGNSRNTASEQVVIEMLRNQITLMETQLETAGKREEKLLEMLATEQEKTKLLMLPHGEPEPSEKKGNWLRYFRLRR